MTITISPDLNKALCQYADEYNRAYGNAVPEPPNELVPYIIQSFLDSDRAFARAQRLRQRENGGSPANGASPPPRRQNGAVASK